MPGVVQRVIPRTLYNFNNVPIGTTFSFPIARFIDISQYREVTIIQRVHTKSILATGSPTLSLVCYADQPTTDDPAQDFTTLAALVTGTTITGATTSPLLTLITVPANAGSMISIWLAVTQGTSAAALQASLSVDISAKS